MEFQILGPVEVIDDAGERLPVGGPKPRAILAMLLLSRGRVVSRDRLLEGLWADRAPPSAEHTLDDYLSRLRRLLGDDRLIRRPPGYALTLDDAELDLERFERLRETARGQPPPDAARTLRASLALWRGAALADVLDQPFAPVEAARLEDQRVAALEERVEADLALGRATEVLAELETVVRDEPFRERSIAQLALALYRAGRQADALAVLAAARRRFAEELGLEPGPQLQQLEHAVLTHDKALALSGDRPTVGPGPHRRARRLAAPVALGLFVAVAVAVPVLLAGRGSRPSVARVPPPSALVAIDAGSARISGGVALSGTATAVAAAPGTLWTADADTDTVSRVDVDKGVVVQRIPVPGSPGSLALGRRSLWVASTTGATVTRIDTATESVTQKIPLGINPAAVASDASGVWVADPSDRSLIRLDPKTGSATRTVALPERPSSIALRGRTAWAASHDAGTLTAVDVPTARVVATVAVGQGPSAIAVGGGSVWIANELDGTVTRVDEATLRVRATIPTGSAPASLAYAGGAVWVGDGVSSGLTRIDPARNRIEAHVTVGGRATAVAAAGGDVFVATAPLLRRHGGVLRMLHQRPLAVDPAINYDIGPLQSDGLTRDSLVTLEHQGGPAGLRLVPDLALALPTVGSGGTTYSFRLRQGIRYSDGRPLRASDFRRAIQRLFALRSPAVGYFDGLVGARACAESPPGQCRLSRGVVTNDAAGTVTFHLTAPDSDFPFKLTVGGFTAPVPAGTPMGPVHSEIPGTGPYRVQEVDRTHIRYTRNRYFREWSHTAQPDGSPDEIVWQFGVPPAEQVRMIEQGRADWTADGIPRRLLDRLRTQHPAQVHINPLAETDFFQINTTRPPFNDLRVRRALNLAIDRRRVRAIYGGSAAAVTTCQTLPPGVPGFQRFCPYQHDFARARRLVNASGTAGEKVIVWGFTDDPTISPQVSRYVADVLRRLGYRARAKLLSHAQLDQMGADVFRTIQLIAAGWVPDFPSAHAMLAIWFRCDGAYNHHFFCRPAIDNWMDRTAQLQLMDPSRAARQWSQIDRRLVAEAAWLPLVNPRAIDFVSERVHGYQRHPILGIIADQLQLR